MLIRCGFFLTIAISLFRFMLILSVDIPLEIIKVQNSRKPLLSKLKPRQIEFPSLSELGDIHELCGT